MSEANPKGSLRMAVLSVFIVEFALWPLRWIGPIYKKYATALAAISDDIPTWLDIHSAIKLMAMLVSFYLIAKCLKDHHARLMHLAAGAFITLSAIALLAGPFSIWTDFPEYRNTLYQLVIGLSLLPLAQRHLPPLAIKAARVNIGLQVVVHVLGRGAMNFYTPGSESLGAMALTAFLALTALLYFLIPLIHYPLLLALTFRPKSPEIRASETAI